MNLYDIEKFMVEQNITRIQFGQNNTFIYERADDVVVRDRNKFSGR
jgi:hypothetical protein